MRRSFADELLKHARENRDIILLTGDLGYGMWDEFAQTLSAQYINCGAAEQSMMDIAVGLALSGKIPVAYSITTFLIYRAFETLRTYIAHERVHVILAGSGRDRDYEVDGYSHDASDVLSFIPLGIKTYLPQRKEEIPVIVEEALRNTIPSFVSLRR